MSLEDDMRSDRIQERERFAAILRRHGSMWRRKGRADFDDLFDALARAMEECDDAGEPPTVPTCSHCGPGAMNDGSRCDGCGSTLLLRPAEDL